MDHLLELSVLEINNRLMLQWGTVQVPGTYANIFYPVTYSVTCLNVQGTAFNTDRAVLNLNARYSNRCEIDYPGSKTGRAMWMSIGY